MVLVSWYSSQDLVQREVIYCVSSLIYTLTKENKLDDEQAVELWTAIDWDDACEAIEETGAKFIFKDEQWHIEIDGEIYNSDSSKQELIREYLDQDLSDYEREPLEHWLVTTWLGDRLEEKGEAVVRDFYGLNAIWCRCTSGMAIAYDHVIKEIYQDLISK